LELEKAEIRLAETEEKLGTVEAFVELLRERYGVRAGERAPARFKGCTLKDAALAIIADKGRVAPQVILAELEAGGFQFGDHPGRQLHAALIHQDKAAKDVSGSWRWTVADQEPLPLEREV